MLQPEPVCINQCYGSNKHGALFRIDLVQPRYITVSKHIVDSHLRFRKAKVLLGLQCRSLRSRPHTKFIFAYGATPVCTGKPPKQSSPTPVDPLVSHAGKILVILIVFASINSQNKVATVITFSPNNMLIIRGHYEPKLLGNDKPIHALWLNE